MTVTVPPLTPKQPGPVLRALGLVVPGIRTVSAQIEPYTRWWSDQNQKAVEADGPLLVVIGDSTAIGIGATSPDLSYASLLRLALSRRDGTDWRIINLAQSGARVDDGVKRQLPVVTALTESTGPPDLVISCIGTNDVVWSSDSPELRASIRRLVTSLPPPSVVAPVAGGSPRVRSVNRAIRNAAKGHGHLFVNPWAEPGPGPRERLAEDRFHPNDLGYRLMARPLARALDAPLPEP